MAAGVTWQGSRYGEADPLLLTTRRDNYYGIDLTA